MSNQTDRLKIREIAKDAWIDAGILTDAKIGRESLSTRFIRDTHISFLEYVTKNFWQTYGQQKRGLWQKRKQETVGLIDSEEFTAEQIYAMWQEKSREK